MPASFLREHPGTTWHLDGEAAADLTSVAQPWRAENAATGSFDLRRRALMAAPDAAWQARIETLLGHKGEPWNAQNGAVLTAPGELEARFYVLHRVRIAAALRSAISLIGNFPGKRQKPAHISSSREKMRRAWIKKIDVDVSLAFGKMRSELV